MAVNDIICDESVRHSHVGAPEAATSSSLQDAAAAACRVQQHQQGNRETELLLSMKPAFSRSVKAAPHTLLLQTG